MPYHAGKRHFAHLCKLRRPRQAARLGQSQTPQSHGSGANSTTNPVTVHSATSTSPCRLGAFGRPPEAVFRRIPPQASLGRHKRTSWSRRWPAPSSPAVPLHHSRTTCPQPCHLHHPLSHPRVRSSQGHPLRVSETQFHMFSGGVSSRVPTPAPPSAPKSPRL